MVDGLDFMLGNWVGVTFDQIRGRCLRMNNVTNTGLSLLACGELVGVVMAGGSVEGMAIDRCPTLGLVSFLEAHIHDLAVSDSYIDGASWQRCRICDGCIIERATIVGLNVRQSTLDGVAIRDTELAADLVLEGARIDGLVLEGVRYAQDLVVRSEGATYGTGARFADRPTSH
jgi:hypothetical protein